MNPREVVPGIVEVGPFYASDFAKRDPDATRGGYFVAGKREFYWYHQGRNPRLGPEWKSASSEEVMAASTWHSRDRALNRARVHLAEISTRHKRREPEEVVA